MPSEDWAFSPAGGARALDWSADVWRAKQPELRAGSTAEPVEGEPRQRGNVTSGDLKLGTCARASRYRSGPTYVPRADQARSSARTSSRPKGADDHGAPRHQARWRPPERSWLHEPTEPVRTLAAGLAGS